MLFLRKNKLLQARQKKRMSIKPNNKLQKQIIMPHIKASNNALSICIPNDIKSCDLLVCDLLLAIQ